MSTSNRINPPGPPRFAKAVHALAWLAYKGSVLSSASLACQVNSHATFLRRILAPLVQAGIVEAREGRDGGYMLKVPAEQLTLAEIYTAVKSTFTETAEGMECGEDGIKLDAALEEVLQEAEKQTLACLQRITLANLMDKANNRP